MSKADIFKRFLSKVKKENNCWIWTRCKNYFGYGLFHYKNKAEKAHRVSYELYLGKIPKNLCVLHKCDIPSCVNPEHLFLGTKKDNTQDMINKGRKGGCHKLTKSEIKEIIDLYTTGKYSQRKIGHMFNTCQTNVSRVINWSKL